MVGIRCVWEVTKRVLIGTSKEVWQQQLEAFLRNPKKKSEKSKIDTKTYPIIHNDHEVSNLINYCIKLPLS